MAGSFLCRIGVHRWLKRNPEVPGFEPEDSADHTRSGGETYYECERCHERTTSPSGIGGIRIGGFRHWRFRHGRGRRSQWRRWQRWRWRRLGWRRLGRWRWRRWRWRWRRWQWRRWRLNGDVYATPSGHSARSSPPSTPAPMSSRAGRASPSSPQTGSPRSSRRSGRRPCTATRATSACMCSPGSAQCSFAESTPGCSTAFMPRCSPTGNNRTVEAGCRRGPSATSTPSCTGR